MNRNHKVFTFAVRFDRTVYAPDPEAPGGGEMRRTGQVDRDPLTITVIATSKIIATSWLWENPHRFPNLVVDGCTETKIDAIIETHTY